MANPVSVPNTFVAATDAVAAEVNANFTSLVNYINNNMVHDDGTVAITGTQTVNNLIVQGTLTAEGNLNVDGDIKGDVIASNGTTKVLDNGTNGTDAWFAGDVRNASAATIVDVSAAQFNGNASTATTTTGNAATATGWASNLTINLGTDLSGSVTFNGDEGTVTLNASVVNDSHTHDGRYYTKTLSDGRFLGINAKAADSDKLDNLNSTQFLRSDTADTITAKFSIDNDGSVANDWSQWISGNHGNSATVSWSQATLVLDDAGRYPSLSWRSLNLGYAAVLRLSTAAANKLVLRNSIDSDWGDLQLGSLTQSSDLTLKTKTGDAPGLDLVSKLTPFKGYWNDGNHDEVHFWLGAQEVATALTAAGLDSDACTVVDSTEDSMGLQYTQLVPVLVKAVQELTARLEAVEAA